MHIHHLAVWVQDLEKMKSFYEKYFNCRAGSKYHNPVKGFSSYFLSFESGAKIELMFRNDILHTEKTASFGLTHFAISVGSKELVNKLTNQLEQDGYTIKGHPRTTGDGYYESVIIDPEGNSVEITV